MEKDKEINLNDYINNRKVLAGRDSGEELNRILNLNDIEKKYKRILIKIPNYVYSFNSSFFLGMFGETVKKLGRDKFKDKYIFETNNDSVRANIEDGINEALNDVSVENNKDIIENKVKEILNNLSKTDISYEISSIIEDKIESLFKGDDK